MAGAFCALRPGQPGPPSRPSETLPPGRFFPLNFCRSSGVMAELNGGGILCSSPRATRATFSTKRNTSSRKIFPPELLQVERSHGRIEWRGHFVLFAKGNQGHLLDQAKHFLPEDFSP